MPVSFRSFTVWRVIDGPGKAFPNRTPEGSTPRESRLVLRTTRLRDKRVLSNTGNLAAVMTTMGHKDVRATMQSINIQTLRLSEPP